MRDCGVLGIFDFGYLRLPGILVLHLFLQIDESPVITKVPSAMITSWMGLFIDIIN